MSGCDNHRTMLSYTTHIFTHAQVMVPVEVEGGRVCEVTVRETAPVISVMFKVAETAGVKLATNSAIFEISESLRIRE